MRKLIVSLAVVFSGLIATAAVAEQVKNGINMGNGANLGNGIQVNGSNLGNAAQSGKPSKARKASRNGGTVTAVQMPAR